jgi:hypothetical protein
MSTTKAVKATEATKPKGELSTTIQRLIVEAPALIKAKDYNSLAELGAAHGASYLTEALRNGKSEEDASFITEAHLYENGKCSACILLPDADSQNDLDNMIAAIFAKVTTPAVLLVIGMQWVSRSAVKNGGRPSEQPDRVNAGVGTVYTAPGVIVALQGKPVFIAKAA